MVSVMLNRNHLSPYREFGLIFVDISFIESWFYVFAVVQKKRNVHFIRIRFDDHVLYPIQAMECVVEHL